MELPTCPKEWLYPSSFEEASRVQRMLAERVILHDAFKTNLCLVAGVDTSNRLYDPEKWLYAACVILKNLSFGSLSLKGNEHSEKQENWKIVERASAQGMQAMPYRTGFLAFREVPFLLKAISALSERPELIFVDGHGIAHPRGLGIASHLGVLLGIPTIGVAKSLLCGQIDGELGSGVGSLAPVVLKGKTIAMALRSRRGALPLIISSGHRISLESAVAWTQRCLIGYKLPEPTRQAHLFANQIRLRRSAQKQNTFITHL